MIPPPSQRFLTALASSHERQIRLTLHLWDAGNVLRPVGPLNVVDATLSLDAVNASWRRLSGNFTLPPETAGVVGGRRIVDGEVQVEFGIGFADGVDWVQVGQLRVEETHEVTAQATRSFDAFDREVRVSDFPFITPYAPRDINGNQLTVVNGIKDIITNAFPSWGPPIFVIDPTVDVATLPPPETSFTGARWDAVLKLAQSVSASVHNDELGRFVIKPQKIPNSPVATVQGGVGGTLVQHASQNTRVDQYNAVGLTCETPSGDGIFVYLVDNDPNSPTYYDGPFGRKPWMTRNDTITTVDDAISAARSLLMRKKSGAHNLSITTVYNPLIEPLDVISVLQPGQVAPESHVVDSIELSLTGAQMTLKTHLWTEEPQVRRRWKGGVDLG